MDISGIVDHYCVKFLVIIFENFVFLTKKNNQLTEFFLFLGDGGNDVSMIQAADAGIGIVGKVQVFIKDKFL